VRLIPYGRITDTKRGKEVIIISARKSGGRSRASKPAKYRRADTGRYTTPGYAKRHPRTTVKESK
jgi:hypothetical protein